VGWFVGELTSSGGEKGVAPKQRSVSRVTSRHKDSKKENEVHPK